mgnify:CR=1 FL=1
MKKKLKKRECKEVRKIAEDFKRNVLALVSGMERKALLEGEAKAVIDKQTGKGKLL